MRWAAAEGVSGTVIAAVLLLHERRVDEIVPSLSAADPHRDFTVDAIQRIATTFDDLEAELYKLQAAIEARLPPEPLPPELLDPE